MRYSKNMLRFVAVAAIAAALGGCARDPNDPGLVYAPEMYEALSYEPFRQVMDSTSPFSDKQVMQTPPDGTIPRGGVGAFAFAAGDPIKASDALKALPNPLPATAEVLAEGKVLYERFCGVCHGSDAVGEGSDGQVAKHDAINPPNLNSGKWVSYAPGQIYHTIMYGQGVMGSYASQLDYNDRWKVVHYVISLRPADAAASDTTAVDSAAK